MSVTSSDMKTDLKLYTRHCITEKKKSKRLKKPPKILKPFSNPKPVKSECNRNRFYTRISKTKIFEPVLNFWISIYFLELIYKNWVYIIFIMECES